MGIGMIVGGALKGYGDGMAEMARSKEEERRERALISFRSERQKEQTQQQADLQDRNSGRQAVYDDWGNARSDERKGLIQEQTDNRRFQQGVQSAQIQLQNEKSLAYYKSKLNMTEAQQASALRMAEEAAKANTYIDRYETDDQGNLVGITVTGKTMRTGVRPMPDAPKGGESAMDRARNKAQGASATPPSSAPAKNVTQTQGGRTYTREDLEFTAQQRGMSTAEIEKQLKAAGYKMVGQ